MDFVTVRARVHRDRIGVVLEIPVILTAMGPLMPLADYLLEHAHHRSFSWMQKMTQGVGLLLAYMAANQTTFADPKALFQSFIQRLYSGTIGANGLDPSGLFWLPKRSASVRQLSYQLAAFSDWMADRLVTTPLSPWCEAIGYEEMLNWAAWHQKHQRSFLGHTWRKDRASDTMKRARNVFFKRSVTIDHAGVKFFPDEQVMDLLFKGFTVPGRRKSRRIEERLNLRDILITILMHFGGVRVSEPFHLYVHDVLPDPLHHALAMVRIYHPSEGLAPADWYDVNGQAIHCHREAYLRGKYRMRPRDQYFPTDQLHAGWKGNLLDSKSHFMHVHWFPVWAGELFFTLWDHFLVQRALKDCDHPFAFVTAEGKPYSPDSFARAHARAVTRIGLVPAKMWGTTSHGHRHAYGQRLAAAGIDPIFCKKALHHQSLESQVVYTEPNVDRIGKVLNEATRILDEGKSLVSPDFLAYGFDDVDPLGLLSGAHPKLRRT